MKFLRDLEKRLNDLVKDHTGARNFGVLWRKHLERAPWADLDSVIDPLTYENSLTFPIFQTQYDSSSGGDEEHRILHHSSWSGECGLKPSENGIIEFFDLLGVNYHDLLEETENLPSLFHDYFYKGPEEAFKDEPPIPLIVKRLVDRTVAGCYWDIYEITSQQWAVQLNLKISHMFTNQPLKICFDVTAFDNGALAEGFWAISSLYPLGTPEERKLNCPSSLDFPPNSALDSYHSRLDTLLNKYNSRIDSLFNNTALLRTALPKPLRQHSDSRNKFERPHSITK